MRNAKQFAIVAVETSVEWPREETIVPFRGWSLVLRPASDTHMPTVVVEYMPPLTPKDAKSLILEFFSSLAWIWGRPVIDGISFSGTCLVNLGRGSDKPTGVARFDASYLPEPSDESGKLALALYREAVSNNSLHYSFLGYYKIINLLNDDARKQQE